MRGDTSWSLTSTCLRCRVPTSSRDPEQHSPQALAVVVLTTTDDSREIQRCYDLGANVYMTKPVNYESFANAVRQLGLFFSVIQVPEMNSTLWPIPSSMSSMLMTIKRWCASCSGLWPKRLTVEHAASPEEALARIAGNMIDVVALDHYLATGTGLDLLSQLASAANSPPVVYVTGSTDMSVAVAALKAGAADFGRRRSVRISSCFSARLCSRR